jgi:hypothetical protein
MPLAELPPTLYVALRRRRVLYGLAVDTKGITTVARNSPIAFGWCNIVEIYKSTREDTKKYVPSQPTSPHWYGPESLKVLVFSHIAHARKGDGPDLPLGTFVRQFQGLTSTAKAKAVTSQMPPGFRHPLEGTTLAGPEFKVGGLKGFLSRTYALPKSVGEWHTTPASVAVAAHIVTPAPLFLDRGKTRLNMEGA